MKYAVLDIGGKQFVAAEGQTIEVDRMASDVGKSVELKDVLLIVDGAKVKVGKPKVAGAKVKVTVAEQVKGPKITVFKFKPKQRYRRKQGHRQPMTRLAIDKITIAAPKKKAEAKDEPKAKKPTKAKTTKTSAKPAAKTKAATKSPTKSTAKKSTAKKNSTKE
jgi:large subunit ribosomal protein L21